MVCGFHMCVARRTSRCTCGVFPTPHQTYIHTYIHKYTYIHTDIHTYRQTYIQTYIHTYIHIYKVHIYIHIHTYTSISQTKSFMGHLTFRCQAQRQKLPLQPKEVSVPSPKTRFQRCAPLQDITKKTGVATQNVAPKERQNRTRIGTVCHGHFGKKSARKTVPSPSVV